MRQLRECDVTLGVGDVTDGHTLQLTPSDRVTEALKVAAQDLLNGYVARQGSALAQVRVTETIIAH